MHARLERPPLSCYAAATSQPQRLLPACTADLWPPPLSAGEEPTAEANMHPNVEHRQIFEGDTEDCFRLGISLTRTTVNLYAEFYSADILIVSPLGLRLIIGADGEKHQEYDFLSSIEVCILDQSEAYLMQNWDHVMAMMAHTNLQPKETRNTDFSRLQRWSAEGKAGTFRRPRCLVHPVRSKVLACFPHS